MGTKFWFTNIRTLRVLRDLRGERNQGNSARLPKQKPEESLKVSMGITSTLSIAAQAMKAQQLAIQTTGHNLANVATPGFSRQRVDLASAHPSFEGFRAVS